MDWYLSPSGSDSATGTLMAPFRSLTYAVSRMLDGDRVLLRGGLYAETTTFALANRKNITIRNFPGEMPEMRFAVSSDYAFQIGSGCADIVVDGISIVRDSTTEGNVCGLVNTVMRNCQVSFAGTYSKYDCVKVLSNGVTVEDCHIHHAPNQGVDAVAWDDLIVRGCIIHDCQNAITVKGGSSNPLIENNTCYNQKYGSIGLGGSTDPLWQKPGSDYEVRGAICRNNTIWYDTPFGIGGGIYLQGALDSHLSGNRMRGGALLVRNSPAFASRGNFAQGNAITCTGDDGILEVASGCSIHLKQNIYWSKTGCTGKFNITGTWMDYAAFAALLFDEGSVFADPGF